MTMERSGPFLAAAVLCEQILQEKDEVLSLIRIVDRFIATAIGPEPPSTMPPAAIALQAVIMLKAGAARGRHTLQIQPEDPSGRKLDAHDLPVTMEGEDRGVNQIIKLNFVAELEGLYWFDIRIDGHLLTRMPLRVIYQPMRQPR